MSKKLEKNILKLNRIIGPLKLTRCMLQDMKTLIQFDMCLGIPVYNLFIHLISNINSVLIGGFWITSTKLALVGCMTYAYISFYGVKC